MTWKHYLGITIISMIILVFLASYQTAPGYMDAEYYYGMGLRIAKGLGLSEPFIWNYLAKVDSIPHPGFSYWMPMPAFLTALGIWITGLASFSGGKVIHIILAALMPALTMKVTLEITGSKFAGILAGLLALFPVFYCAFMITTDSFSSVMILGGLFFLLTKEKESLLSFLGLGLVAGVMHLSRADGMLWIIAGVYCAIKSPRNKTAAFVSVLGGYLLMMAPWFIRNLFAVGQLMPPGISKALWLTEYNDLFAYSTSGLTYRAWISQGFRQILSNYLGAGIANLKTAALVQGQIILAPFICLGVWKHRRDKGLQAIFLVWICVFVMMSFVFPFAGRRGGFLHSSAAFQSIAWGMAASGFISMIDWGVTNRNWDKPKARLVFGGILVSMVVVAGAFVFSGRVISGDRKNPAWNQSQDQALRVAGFFSEFENTEDEIVMINNPPGFYAASGRSSIVIPNGDVEQLLLASEEYGAHYLVLEGNHPQELNELYNNPEFDERIKLIGRAGGAIIFKLTDGE